jgi:fermentation-respiration switch protein FrsA (DUF1100 family)
MMRISMADTMTNEGRQFHEIKNLSDTPAGRAIEGFTGCFLVVASEKDAIIPATLTRGYVDLAKHAKQTKLVVIKDATHTLTERAWKQEFSRVALDWFTETLQP